jgi:chromosome partitioning protein
MRTIAIINQKGGCGKTTTAINLAAMLARAGRRCLLVDMDPQSHCAAGLGVPESRIEWDIGDAMLAVGQRPLDLPRMLWRVARNLDLVPSRMKLAGLEASRGGLAELLDREKRLALVLQALRHDYDVACIDCPPTIGLLTYNALAAADVVLVPVETGFFSLQGASKQVNTVKALVRRLGVQTPIWLLPTIHEHDNGVAADLLREMHRRFKDRMAPVVIRRDVGLREAAAFGQPIADYKPDSDGARDYADLAAWVGGLSGGVPAESEPAGDTGEALPEVTVPAISPRVLAERAPEPQPVREPKELPSSRAGDVARRAQEFLRKVALGRSGPAAAAAEAPATPAPTPPIEPPPITVVAKDPVGTALRLVESPIRATAPSPALVRLLGVHETNQGVLFVQPLSVGHRVAIAGTFNNWSATAHELRPNPALGVHELCLKLPPGRFLYRLVIDGQWSADPYNNECEPNPFGEINSVFVVGATRAVGQSA